jgi:hypothetical protein
MTPPTPDPVLVSSRREALVIGGLFLVAMTYTVTVCAVMGYDRDPATLKFVLGFPDWIFWGIVVPWGVCIVGSFVFGGLFMRDEVLEGDEPSAEAATGNGGAA